MSPAVQIDADEQSKLYTVTMVQPEMTEKWGRLLPGYEVDMSLEEAVSFVNLGLAKSDEIKSGTKSPGRVRRPHEEEDATLAAEQAAASQYSSMLNSPQGGALIHRLEQRIAELEAQMGVEPEAPKPATRRASAGGNVRAPGTQRAAGPAGTAAQRRAQEEMNAPKTGPQVSSTDGRQGGDGNVVGESKADGSHTHPDEKPEDKS